MKIEQFKFSKNSQLPLYLIDYTAQDSRNVLIRTFEFLEAGKEILS